MPQRQPHLVERPFQVIAVGASPSAFCRHESSAASELRPASPAPSIGLRSRRSVARRALSIERTESARASQSVSRATTKSCGNRSGRSHRRSKPRARARYCGSACRQPSWRTHRHRYNLISTEVNQIVAVSFCLSMVFSENRFHFSGHASKFTRAKPAPPPHRASSSSGSRGFRGGDQTRYRAHGPKPIGHGSCPWEIPGPAARQDSALSAFDVSTRMMS